MNIVVLAGLIALGTSSASAASLEAQVAALPFTVGDEADFRPVSTIDGNAVVLTDGPRDEDPAFRQPIVVVDRDLREAPPEHDRAAFARANVLDMASRYVGDVAILGSKLSSVDGEDVVRIDATGEKPPSRKPAALIAFVRFGKRGVIRTLCVLPRMTHGEYADRCTQLARSIHAK